MRKHASIVAVAALLGLLMPPAHRAVAQSCGAAVEAAKQHWWALTQGNHRIPPTMQLNTSDGRRLTGAQLNYAWVLVARAEDACAAAQAATASGYLRDFELLVLPPPRRS